jgi:DNA-directed RNA polymerase subunit M/transcription elongation factor TFIIS
MPVKLGVGFAYSPDAVFYGRSDDMSKNWAFGFPDGMCEPGKPLLLELMPNCDSRKRAIALLQDGAQPDEHYGHQLYVCPHCNRLENLFYFRLQTSGGYFEPEYECQECHTILIPVILNQNNGSLNLMDNENKKFHWKCPSCGNEKLVYSHEILMWD